MKLEQGLLDFRGLDLLARGESVVHRCDARAKLLVVLVFLVCVMSFDRHAIAPLLPYFAFPIVIAAAAGLPFSVLARKVVLVLPFAVAVGLANPWFEREVVVVGDRTLSAGWLSLASIVLRSLLAGAAAVVLVAVAGFPALCAALARLGVPRPLVVQLMFLHRYLVVVGEEAARMTAARAQRSGGSRLSMRGYATLAGQLLLKSLDRAERIHRAMRARGFDGSYPLRTPGRLRARDAAVAVALCALLVLLRRVEVVDALGRAVVGRAA